MFTVREFISDIVPKLEPFDYKLHYNNQFINQEWVLLNSIEDQKSTYLFKPNNELLISEHNNVTKTRWSFINSNFIAITTADGIVLLKAYYKDKDMLVLNQKASEEYSFFINTTGYSEAIATKEDVQEYLKKKYMKKAADIIYEHKFYFIQRSKEHGPYTMKQLFKMVKDKAVNTFCLVRDVNETDYNGKLRIKDILQEL